MQNILMYDKIIKRQRHILEVFSAFVYLITGYCGAVDLQRGPNVK